MEVLLETTGLLEDLHHLVTIHRLGLEEGHEVDVLGVYCLIVERRGKGIQVVGSDGGILPVSAESVMQLLLEIEEGTHGSAVEVDVSEDG